MSQESSILAWREGRVDRSVQHFELRYSASPRTAWEDRLAVALVGPPYHRVVNVELLAVRDDPSSQAGVAAAIAEVEFYLVEKREFDAWLYAQYHCGTMANAYSKVHWGFFMSGIDEAVVHFRSEVNRFPGFERLSFAVGELADPDWEWGYDHGVYCFVADGEVVYVGRALGCTLGQRIADQLRSTDDPWWESVVTSPGTRVEVFPVREEYAYMAAALEAYLIRELDPSGNSRLA